MLRQGTAKKINRVIREAVKISKTGDFRHSAEVLISELEKLKGETEGVFRVKIETMIQTAREFLEVETL